VTQVRVGMVLVGIVRVGMVTCTQGTRHVKCYSHHANTSVTVSASARNATVRDNHNTE